MSGRDDGQRDGRRADQSRRRCRGARKRTRDRAAAAATARAADKTGCNGRLVERSRRRLHVRQRDAGSVRVQSGLDAAAGRSSWSSRRPRVLRSSRGGQRRRLRCGPVVDGRHGRIRHSRLRHGQDGLRAVRRPRPLRHRRRRKASRGRGCRGGDGQRGGVLRQWRLLVLQVALLPDGPLHQAHELERLQRGVVSGVEAEAPHAAVVVAEAVEVVRAPLVAAVARDVEVKHDGAVLQRPGHQSMAAVLRIAEGVKRAPAVALHLPGAAQQTVHHAVHAAHALLALTHRRRTATVRLLRHAAASCSTAPSPATTTAYGTGSGRPTTTTTTSNTPTAASTAHTRPLPYGGDDAIDSRTTHTPPQRLRPRPITTSTAAAARATQLTLLSHLDCSRSQHTPTRQRGVWCCCSCCICCACGSYKSASH